MMKKEIPVYTKAQISTKLIADAKAGENCEIVSVLEIAGVSLEVHEGEPCLVVYHIDVNGDAFGVILDKQYADELTKKLGPHPLVEKFFRLH